jgi:UDP-glucose 4-epimerase
MSRILITGVRGFIGRALAPLLVADGHDVSGTSRDSAAQVDGVILHPVADLGREMDWAPVFQGVDAVVHLAAQVHTAADEATHMRVNAEGTQALAEAAAAAGVRRFVYLSTVKVHGEETPPGAAFAEDDPPRPEDAYGRSKWAAEQALVGVSGLQTVILRPPLVYGPGVGANFAALLRLCDRGIPLPFGAIDNRRSLVYRGNLVDAIRLSLIHENAPGCTFLVSDGSPVSTPDLVRAIRAAQGRTPGLIPLPGGVLRAAAALAWRSAAADRLIGSLAVDDSLIRQRLGWQPPFAMADGLAATVADSGTN